MLFLSKKTMETVVLNGNSKENLKLLIELAKKLGFTAKILTDTEKEDIALHEAIKQGRTNKFVEVESFIEEMKK
jgi:hypothetical protein